VVLSPPATAKRAAAAGQPRLWYRVLGLAAGAGASAAVLKRAYRQQALRYHPDKCQIADGGATFKLVRLSSSAVLRSGLVGQRLHRQFWWV
jgi:hypothetical protein